MIQPHTTPVDRDDGGPPDYDHPEQQEYLAGKPSQSQSREQEHRLNDDLAMLQAERVVSQRHSEDPNHLSHSTSVGRTRSRYDPRTKLATPNLLINAYLRMDMLTLPGKTGADRPI